MSRWTPHLRIYLSSLDAEPESLKQQPPISAQTDGQIGRESKLRTIDCHARDGIASALEEEDEAKENWRVQKEEESLHIFRVLPCQLACGALYSIAARSKSKRGVHEAAEELKEKTKKEKEFTMRSESWRGIQEKKKTTTTPNNEYQEMKELRDGEKGATQQERISLFLVGFFWPQDICKLGMEEKGETKQGRNE